MSVTALTFFLATTDAQAGTINAAKTAWTPLSALTELDDPIQVDVETDTTSGTLLGVSQDKSGNVTAISWEFTLQPEAQASKAAWLAVADTDTFASVDAFIHDAMRSDLDDALGVGETLYARVAGPDGDGSYILTGVVGERNHIEGLNALEVANKGIYTARATLQVGKGVAQVSTGTPWGILTGSVDIVGGIISAVVGLASDDTTATGNVYGWDDVEDAVIDYTVGTVGSLTEYLFSDEEAASDPDADYLDALDREREAKRAAQESSGSEDDAATGDTADTDSKTGDDTADDSTGASGDGSADTAGGESGTDCTDAAAEGCKDSGDDSSGGGDSDPTTSYPDFEEEADPELMEQFLAFSAWLGVDPYNTDKLVEAMGYTSEGGEKNSVDVAFVEASWLDYTCAISSARCLGTKEGVSTEYVNLAVLDTMCDGELCIGLSRGGTLSPSGLLKLDNNLPLDASTTEKLTTFEISR